jgi:hypothetical protein
MSNMTQVGIIDFKSPGVPVTTPNDTGDFFQVTFPTPFQDGTQVVVFPMVQTFNGSDTPGLRIADVDIKGFKIRMNELVASGKSLADGSHSTETIGWMAYTV